MRTSLDTISVGSATWTHLAGFTREAKFFTRFMAWLHMLTERETCQIRNCMHLVKHRLQSRVPFHVDSKGNVSASMAFAVSFNLNIPNLCEEHDGTPHAIGSPACELATQRAKATQTETSDT